jgi:hypothetical protein
MKMMSDPTALPDLITAYRNTRYWVFADPDRFFLTIGARSREIHGLFGRFSVSTAAFITAYNPYSEAASESENEQVQGSLKADLERLSKVILFGEGAGADGDWPPEPSILALGLSRRDAEGLGRKYKQNAIVWISGNCVPELVMLVDVGNDADGRNGHKDSI